MIWNSFAELFSSRVLVRIFYRISKGQRRNVLRFSFQHMKIVLLYNDGDRFCFVLILEITLVEYSFDLFVFVFMFVLFSVWNPESTRERKKNTNNRVWFSHVWFHRKKYFINFFIYF